MADRTAFITGLRGYSALAVYMKHAGNWLSFNAFPNFSTFGHNGVVSFFLISAVTIGLSLRRTTMEEDFSYGNYLIKRFLRIAPLYYLVCLILFATGSDPNGGAYYQKLYGISQHDLTNLFMHLSFLNMFSGKYQNTLIGVEWTIAVEFLWYLVLPFMYLAGRLSRFALYFMLWPSLVLFLNPYWGIATIMRKGLGLEPFHMAHWAAQMYTLAYVLGLLIEDYHSDKPRNRWADWGLVAGFALTVFMAVPKGGFRPYVIALFGLFTLGAALSKAGKRLNGKAVRAISENIVILGLFAVFAIYLRGPQQDDALFTALWISVLVLECRRRSWISRVVFENRAIIRLGEASYSIYLLHFLALPLWKAVGLPRVGALAYLAGTAFTVGLSMATYRYVEKPFIALSHRLTARGPMPSLKSA